MEQNNAEAFPQPLNDDDEFYRALRPEWIKGGGKISAGAFSNATQTNRMSVDWSDKATPQETFDRWAKWGSGRGVATVAAEVFWNNGQEIRYKPVEGNCAHSEVVGSKPDRVRKTLAKGAKLVIPPSTTSDSSDI